MYFGALPIRQIRLSRNHKTLQPGNFLNKVNESVLFSLLFLSDVSFVVNKNLYFFADFFIITMNMTSVLFLLIVCIFIT